MKKFDCHSSTATFWRQFCSFRQRTHQHQRQTTLGDDDRLLRRCSSSYLAELYWNGNSSDGMFCTCGRGNNSLYQQGAVVCTLWLGASLFLYGFASGPSILLHCLLSYAHPVLFCKLWFGKDEQATRLNSLSNQLRPCFHDFQGTRKTLVAVHSHKYSVYVSRKWNTRNHFQKQQKPTNSNSVKITCHNLDHQWPSKEFRY